MPERLETIHIIDLVREATQVRQWPVRGRERELSLMARVFERDQMNNVVVTGGEGVGKTALLRGLAQAAVKGSLQGIIQTPILELDLKWWQEKMNRAHDPAAKLRLYGEALGALPACILVIDKAEVLLEYVMNTAQMADVWSKFWQKQRHRLVLALSLEGEIKFKENYPKYVREFEWIRLDELGKADVVEILRDRAAYFGFKHNIKMAANMPEAIYDLASQLPASLAMPERAIRFLDDIGAEAVVQGRRIVAYEDAQRVLSDKLGMSTIKVQTRDRKAIAGLGGRLAAQVIGQDQAVNMVTKVIERSWLGLKNPDRPLGSFLFLGPSGVGKTEVARVLARELYGGDKAMVRVDMSEYQEAHNVQRLIGAPPGYVGYESGGQLTNPVQQRPYSLVLLDEIEKADKAVFDIFLQVLEDGRLTDGQGRTIDFRKTVIVATSNIGISEIVTDWQAGEDVTSAEWLSRRMLPLLTKYFRWEFLNRFEGIAVFAPFAPETLVMIGRLELQKIERRFSHLGVNLSMSDNMIRQHIEQKYDPRFGVRPLKRWLEQTAESAIGQWMMKETI